MALALGIGANTAIFSVVHGVLLEPLPYRAADRLVLLSDNFRKLDMADIDISPAEFFDYRDRTHSFDEMAAYVGGSANLTGMAEPERVSIANVTANLFPLLGVAALHGRSFTAREEVAGSDHVVVLGNAIWKRRFGGDSGVIGRDIVLEGAGYKVVGVMPPQFDFPSKCELWIPMGLDRAQYTIEQRGGRWLRAIARLKPSATTETARADLKRLVGELAISFPKNYPSGMGFEVGVRTLDDAIVGDVRPALEMLMIAVGLVLLVACANVANLLLGKGSARAREIAVRTALGAKRSRLIRQLLTESLMLSLAGAAIGVLLALWGTDLVRLIASDTMPRVEKIGIDAEVLAYTLGAAVFTAILFGLVPALRVSRAHLGSELNGVHGSDGSHKGLRNGLVIAETALALVLLIGAGLMLRSFARLNGVAPGFDPENVLTLKIALPASKYAEGTATADLYNRLLARLRGLRGVSSAAIASIVPVDGGGLSRSFVVDGSKRENGAPPPIGEWRVVSPDYFRTLGIALLGGREFTDADRDTLQGTVIVNRTLARRWWPGASPIGKRIKFFPPAGDPWRTVVGVVGDVRQFTLDAGAVPEMYSPFAQFPTADMTVAVRGPGDPMRLLPVVQAEIRMLDRDLPISDVATMTTRLARTVMGRRLNTTLLAIFAGVALLLATIGTYGVTAYAVARRTRELGIRIALGAAPRDVLWMVLRSGMALSLAGVVVGIVGALAATRLAVSLLYEVDPFDPGTYVAVALVLVAAAFLATYIPARRATRINPMVALRYE